MVLSGELRMHVVQSPSRSPDGLWGFPNHRLNFGGCVAAGSSGGASTERVWQRHPAVPAALLRETQASAAAQDACTSARAALLRGAGLARVRGGV